MTDELSLDVATVAQQLADASAAADAARDPWLVRREHGWGASEIAALLLAYDPIDVELRTARQYHLDDAAIGRLGVPRTVARKARLARARPQTATMRAGHELERELVARWAAQSGYDDVQHADAAPREWYPLVDRECPRLTATPDAWCRGPCGELIAVEAKCTREHPGHALPWYWRVQVQAQIAVMSAAAGCLVCGPGWIVGSGAEPVSWLVERDDAEIERIRRVVVVAWDAVERLREMRQ
jgi:hypothetical protein